MTSHRLIRSDGELLLRHACRLHPGATGSDAGVTRAAHWRGRAPVAGRHACWRTRLPDGSVLSWCLEVEPGANGILAHLTVAPLAGRLTRLPGAVARWALHPWAQRELAVLARAVEPVVTGRH